jgi:hypothetical protein
MIPALEYVSVSIFSQACQPGPEKWTMRYFPAFFPS